MYYDTFLTIVFGMSYKNTGFNRGVAVRHHRTTWLSIDQDHRRTILSIGVPHLWNFIYHGFKHNIPSMIPYTRIVTCRYDRVIFWRHKSWLEHYQAFVVPFLNMLSRALHNACVLQTESARCPFCLTLIPTWITNHMRSKVWDIITCPLPNFSGVIIEFGNG